MSSIAFRFIAALTLVLAGATLFLLRTPQAPVAHVAAATTAVSTLKAPDVSGDAAIAYDLQTGAILFQKNAAAQLPLASITKVMTVLVASEVLDLNETVTIPEAALWREGESGLQAGGSWRVRELVDLTLISSSNDGAQALMLISEPRIRTKYPQAPQHDAFLWRMNERAREMGLTQTYFLDPTGLDMSATMASAYGSAYDIARLIGTAGTAYTDWFSGTAQDGLLLVPEFADGGHDVHNTNAAANQIPGLIAGKTGYTDLAGGNLAILFDAGLGHPIAIVTLHATRETRFTDIETLVAFAQKHLTVAP